MQWFQMITVCFLITKNSGLLGLGLGVTEAPHVCILHSPGVAQSWRGSWPPPAVTLAEEAGALGGLRARPKGSGSHGPAGAQLYPEEEAGCVVWDGEGSGFRPAASYPAEVFTMGTFANY